MATKTLIRSKKKHEVQLKEGSHLAQSQQAPTADEPPVPALIRKTNRVRRTSDTPDLRTGSVPSIKTAVTKTTSVKAVSAKTSSARGKATPQKPGVRPPSIRASAAARRKPTKKPSARACQRVCPPTASGRPTAPSCNACRP